MVKKIKFPLQMKDGYKVRTMEELRVHSDPESLIGYFLDGKLKNWLKDRYYQEEIDEINKLKSSDDKLLQNLYDILNINKNPLLLGAEGKQRVYGTTSELLFLYRDSLSEPNGSCAISGAPVLPY